MESRLKAARNLMKESNRDRRSATISSSVEIGGSGGGGVNGGVGTR